MSTGLFDALLARLYRMHTEAPRTKVHKEDILDGLTSTEIRYMCALFTHKARHQLSANSRIAKTHRRCIKAPIKLLATQRTSHMTVTDDDFSGLLRDASIYSYLDVPEHRQLVYDLLFRNPNMAMGKPWFVKNCPTYYQYYLPQLFPDTQWHDFSRPTDAPDDYVFNPETHLAERKEDGHRAAFLVCEEGTIVVSRGGTVRYGSKSMLYNRYEMEELSSSDGFGDLLCVFDGERLAYDTTRMEPATSAAKVGLGVLGGFVAFDFIWSRKHPNMYTMSLRKRRRYLEAHVLHYAVGDVPKCVGSHTDMMTSTQFLWASRLLESHEIAECMRVHEGVVYKAKSEPYHGIIAEYPQVGDRAKYLTPSGWMRRKSKATIDVMCDGGKWSTLLSTETTPVIGCLSINIRRVDPDGMVVYRSIGAVASLSETVRARVAALPHTITEEGFILAEPLYYEILADVQGDVLRHPRIQRERDIDDEGFTVSTWVEVFGM